jgi:uncharacterized membrane-anchored protein
MPVPIGEGARAQTQPLAVPLFPQLVAGPVGTVTDTSCIVVGVVTVVSIVTVLSTASITGCILVVALNLNFGIICILFYYLFGTFYGFT